jgi:hypothetical protein
LSEKFCIKVRIGNLAEQAAVLKILARCARLRGNSSGVESYCQQALAIYRKLNRPDLIRQLKAAFAEPGHRTLP